MQNIQKTRFLAANYSNLQGLRTVPISLLLLLVVLWANTQRGPASDLTLPILFCAGAILLTWFIQRYYQSHYGKVETTPRQKKVEIILGVGGSVVGLAAFMADTGLHLPFSCIGLTFSAAFLIEFGRLRWLEQGRYLLRNALIYASILFVVSVLPLLGFTDWWNVIGLRGQLYGVLVIASVLMLVAGLFGHWSFVHQLPAEEA